jgi:hypothetical protein
MEEFGSPMFADLYADPSPEGCKAVAIVPVGVLKITLAKTAEAKPKQIKVNVGSEKILEAKAPGKAA